MPRILLEF